MRRWTGCLITGLFVALSGVGPIAFAANVDGDVVNVQITGSPIRNNPGVLDVAGPMNVVVTYTNIAGAQTLPDAEVTLRVFRSSGKTGDASLPFLKTVTMRLYSARDAIFETRNSKLDLQLPGFAVSTIADGTISPFSLPKGLYFLAVHVESPATVIAPIPGVTDGSIGSVLSTTATKLLLVGE